MAELAGQDRRGGRPRRADRGPDRVCHDACRASCGRGTGPSATRPRAELPTPWAARLALRRGSTWTGSGGLTARPSCAPAEPRARRFTDRPVGREMPGFRWTRRCWRWNRAAGRARPRPCARTSMIPAFDEPGGNDSLRLRELSRNRSRNSPGFLVARPAKGRHCVVLADAYDALGRTRDRKPC